MAKREHRPSQFNTDGGPDVGTHVELLCEDHNGTYVLSSNAIVSAMPGTPLDWGS